MDKDRQIRFLYPPLFFLAFVLSALVLDRPTAVKEWLDTFGGTEKVLTIIAGGGIVILVLGLLIGTLSSLLLRALFFLAGWRRYEAVLSRETLLAIWPRLGTTQIVAESKYQWRRQAFYGGVSFDHAIFPRGIHLWLMRRWSAFNISYNSAVAIVLSLIVVRYYGIPTQADWVLIAAMVIAALALNAVFAWRETMSMIQFQATCNLPGKKGEGDAVRNESSKAVERHTTGGDNDDA